MSTFLFDEFVFGPIKSRRLGNSLGINLLSTTQKVCNFNCIYCECGLTKKAEKEKSLFCGKEIVLKLLSERLIQCKNQKIEINSITFAGNGEPTLHPNFLSIIRETIKLRDIYFPESKISVLTNGYTLNKKRIQDALSMVELPIIKLDAGSDIMLKTIDQPKGQFKIATILNNIESFNKQVVIQTMFLKGEINGKKFDNSKGEELNKWIEVVRKINPKLVMLYSLDRDTPMSTIYAIGKDELLEIAARLNLLNIKTQTV
jgi:wyosine [tRNA(Phe)-imidazoG37] synthetase (radical SAM superfamily)